MRFDELAADEAAEYCEFVRRVAPIRLNDLAHLIGHSSRPMEGLDASLASLVPLWEWTMEYVRADCPGIPAGTQSSMDVFLERDPGAFAAPFVVAELLEEYVFRVVLAVKPDARWAPDTDRRSITFGRPMLSYGSTRVSLAGMMRASVDYFLKGRPSHQEAQFLREFVMGAAIEGSRGSLAAELARVGAGSILSPLLSQPQLAWDDPVRLPPTFPAKSVLGQAPELPGVAGSELLLARPGVDIEDLENSEPLDGRAVLAGLDRLGFVTNAGLRSGETEFLDGFIEFELGDTAGVILLVHGGELRAVQLTSVNASAEQWANLVAEFDRLALGLMARLAPEDEF